MLNFCVGPVQMYPRTLEVGSQQVPYFRTREFSELMLENEAGLLKLFDAPAESRIVFLTGSGTSAMEASIANLFTREDRLLIVNGGGFGQRFVDIAQHYAIPFDQIRLEPGQAVTVKVLETVAPGSHSAFLVNLDETSTGVLHDLSAITEFCQTRGLFLVVDAVSAFLTDPMSMQQAHIDVAFTGSQKALALSPGMSFVALSPRAIQKLKTSATSREFPIPYYLDFADHLKNGERGQTPFTPAVSVLFELHDRLEMIQAAGGLTAELQRVKAAALLFRKQVTQLGFELFAQHPATGLTALIDPAEQAVNLFETLKDDYQIWICPNGGKLAQKIFRVGHMGNLTTADYDRLLHALAEVRSGKIE